MARKTIHKQHVAENLSSVIEASGLSQSKFARRIGVTPSKLGNWLRGENYPDPVAMIRVCEAFGVSMDWLYRRKIFGIDASVADCLRAAAEAFRAEEVGQ